MTGVSLKFAALTCAAVLSFSSAAKAADIVVLDSTHAGLAAGSIVSDAANVDIPTGALVTLIMASGETRTVAGPYAGPIGAAQTSDATLQTQEVNGSDTKVLGAVRAPTWEQSN